MNSMPPGTTGYEPRFCCIEVCCLAELNDVVTLASSVSLKSLSAELTGLTVCDCSAEDVGKEA